MSYNVRNQSKAQEPENVVERVLGAGKVEVVEFDWDKPEKHEYKFVGKDNQRSIGTFFVDYEEADPIFGLLQARGFTKTSETDPVISGIGRLYAVDTYEKKVQAPSRPSRGQVAERENGVRLTARTAQAAEEPEAGASARGVAERILARSKHELTPEEAQRVTQPAIDQTLVLREMVAKLPWAELGHAVTQTTLLHACVQFADRKPFLVQEKAYARAEEIMKAVERYNETHKKAFDAAQLEQFGVHAALGIAWQAESK